MSAIKKIEIICLHCHKCEVLKKNFENIMGALQNFYNIKIKYELIHRQSRKEVLAEIARLGFALNQLPVVLINDEVTFIGHVLGESIIRMKLVEIMKA